MKLRPCLVLTLLTLCVAAPRAFAADNDEAVLKATEQTWITAIVNTDRVTLDKLLDDSFVETSPNGQRRSKSDLLLAPPPPPGSTQVLMDLDVHLNGDTAIVIGTNHFKPNATAQPVDYSFTDVFVRRADGWRAVSSQMTRR
ncbi:nuclear transport factor 2 family protein [Paraburkholderia sediminicola]|uniref:nuclear transport factor 2 family protein n=1 Tax=Paraburkholderia sediminicola TaxID=458836 RepID=UPI0038BC0CB3